MSGLVVGEGEVKVACVSAGVIFSSEIYLEDDTVTGCKGTG